MDNLELIRYEGLVGISQLVGAFKKMGRHYRVIAGAGDDAEAYDRIGTHLHVLDVKKRLTRVDIGLLGHTFRGMYDIEIDKTKLKGAIGPNVFYLDVGLLLNHWQRITDQQVADYQEELDRDLPIPKHVVTQEDMRKSLRLGMALRELVLRFNLEGVSVLGQHHVEMATRASADFTPYPVEKIGCMHTFEGDLGNLVMKVILQRLSGSLPVFLEWTAFDEPSNTLLLTHHGVVDPACFADLSRCRWTPAPEKWDFTGNGLSVEYAAKPGRVTLGSLIDDSGGWKILISEGECAEMACRPAWAPQFYFRPQMRVTTYIERFLEEGVAHHIILAYGDHREQLELLADYLGVRKVVV
jgi:L-arabinose isomerase